MLCGVCVLLSRDRCLILVVAFCLLLFLTFLVGVCCLCVVYWSSFVGLVFVGWCSLFFVCCVFPLWVGCCCMSYVVRCLLFGVRVTLVVACCVLFAVCAMSCGGCRYLLSVAYWLVLVVCGVIFVACVV